MITIIFSIIDDRMFTGCRFICKDFDTIEQCEEYMFKYHNRATGWYTLLLEDNTKLRKYNKTGVRL